MSAIVTFRVNGLYDIADPDRGVTIGQEIHDHADARQFADDYNLTDLLDDVTLTLHTAVHPDHAFADCASRRDFQTQAHALHAAGLLPTITEFAVGRTTSDLSPVDEAYARVAATTQVATVCTRRVTRWQPAPSN